MEIVVIVLVFNIGFIMGINWTYINRNINK